LKTSRMRVFAFVLLICVYFYFAELSVIVALMIHLRGDHRVLNLILVGLHCYHSKVLHFQRFLIFCLQLCLFTFGSNKNCDDLVSFSRHEIEIRKLLIKNDAYNRLHLVDTWLEKYRGSEQKLIHLLQLEFSKQQSFELARAQSSHEDSIQDTHSRTSTSNQHLALMAMPSFQGRVSRILPENVNNPISSNSSPSSETENNFYSYSSRKRRKRCEVNYNNVEEGKKNIFVTPPPSELPLEKYFDATLHGVRNLSI